MNELWAVVMWDAELEEWDRRLCHNKEAARKEMIDWVRAQFEYFDLDYEMRKNDEQEIEFVNNEVRVLAVVRSNTATFDWVARANIEWYMFRVN